jgi:hypothetical protein
MRLALYMQLPLLRRGNDPIRRHEPARPERRRIWGRGEERNTDGAGLAQMYPLIDLIVLASYM